MTPLRQECQQFMEGWVAQLGEVKDVLEVGIAGDVKPGGNYYLFQGKGYKTMDIDAKYKPDYVDDITNLNGSTPQNSFDVVLLSNTIEHTYEPFRAIMGAYLLLREGGWLIVDCPWVYPYHAEDGFPDCWRISDDGLKYLLEKAGFQNIQVRRGLHCTSGMAQK